ncbi:putative RING finger protein P8B7.15c [Lachnellula suecica]|uniref:Putative RING finger protein P8B7.15c n=1 Tax=Lachnellula suecica TaxID=602035 RepID=A0A8T9BZ32_9HELO|nr:putative RING finger protein P8B7.15c [Lachnellula suecica]
MSSSVFFKFKSQRDPSRVEFDGTGISVFELKRDIIIKSGLGDGTDFDLAIYHEDGKEEYDDDTTIIPRSTSVIARRLPPIKPGAGRAARYMSGKMPINMKNSSRKEQSSNKSAAKPSSTTIPTQMNSAMTEEQRMAAMFQAQSEQWTAQQEEMATQAPVFRPGGKKGQAAANVPAHDPPVGYICYRCGEKGHWIQLCPTNDDPNFDNKPRVKRTTGIPKSFLKTVEKPAALINDGTTDDTKLPSGVMVNADGDFVVAEPDKASWEKFQAKTKSSAAAQKAAAAGDKELQDRGLECSIDKRIFIDPMKTPCCEKTYCNDCITNALIESDFNCPGCQSDGILIDDLKTDDETSAKIKTYLEEKTAEKKAKDMAEKAEKQKSPSPSVKAVSTPVPVAEEKSKTKSPSPNPSVLVKSPSKSPLPATSIVAPAQAPVNGNAAPASKKRPADELLENPKIPKGPKAMQQQEAQKQAMYQQQAMMNGMNGMGFPNMPFDMSQNFYGGNGMNPMMNGFGMGGMNPMMNPMMPYGGFPNMNMNMYGNGGGYGGGNMGMMNGGGNHMNGQGNHQANGNHDGANGGGAGVAGGFPNQQKTVFAEPLPNEEDNAYFRKPVNPHRHQGKQRRARPSDYREL